MGNCQAIDAASLVIQHPNGKVEKMYSCVNASEIMKINPGYFVALLITTTICHTNNDNSTKSLNKTTVKPNNNNDAQKNGNSKCSDSKSSSSNITAGKNSVRITRVKLLRPMDTLALGHVYRLISTQEVMKGLVAKKQAKMRKNGIELADSEGLKEVEKFVKNALQDNSHHQVSKHGQRSRTASSAKGGTRSKTWQPSLNSISEFTS